MAAGLQMESGDRSRGLPLLCTCGGCRWTCGVFPQHREKDPDGPGRYCPRRHWWLLWAAWGVTSYLSPCLFLWQGSLFLPLESREMRESIKLASLSVRPVELPLRAHSLKEKEPETRKCSLFFWNTLRKDWMNLNFHDFKNLLDLYFYLPKRCQMHIFLKDHMSNLRMHLLISVRECFFLSIRANDEIKEKELDLGT